MKKFTSNQLGPSFTLSSALHALSCLRLIYSTDNLDFSREFKTPHYKIFNAARTALGEIAGIIPKNKKVGIPAFCCAVMATPFLSAGFEIEWIDCDENGLIDINDLKAKSREISAVIVPHTFGQKVDMKQISAIAKQNNIFVIEDGAHLFEPISQYADAKILSFGREKDVSCVSGGALLWHEESEYAENFKKITVPSASKIWTTKHLLQPFILSLSLSFWYYGGRFIAGIWSKLGLFPRAVTSSEKSGYEDFPRTSMPRAIQEVLKKSLMRRNSDLVHRKKISNKWREVIPKIFPKARIIIPDNFFRVILTEVNREGIKACAKKIGFDLNEWDGEPISPTGVNLAKFDYRAGDCPQSEEYMRSYITLPTNIRVHARDVLRFK